MDAQAIVNTIGSLLMSSEDDRITGKNQSLYAEPLDKVFTPYRRPIRRTLRHAGMPLKYLWAGSPCRSADRSPLRHARMPLRHLWAGSPYRRPVRRTLCHAITCIRWAPPASRVRVSTCLSEVFRCPLPSIFMKFTWHANLHYRYL